MLRRPISRSLNGQPSILGYAARRTPPPCFRPVSPSFRANGQQMQLRAELIVTQVFRDGDVDQQPAGARRQLLILFPASM